MEDLFAFLNDWQLIGALSVAIETVYGYDQLVSSSMDIPTERKIIHCVWSVTGFIMNEGFERLWMLDKLYMEEYIVSLRAIGCDYLSKGVSESFALLPIEILGDDAAVEAHFGGYDAVRNSAAPYLHRICNEFEDIVSKLGQYIRLRRLGFSDIEKAIRKRAKSTLPDYAKMYRTDRQIPALSDTYANLFAHMCE